jgi:hypothetical protein
MSGPGDDFNDAPDCGATPPHPATQHATFRSITHGMLVARGITPAQACNVGCSICGVIDASPKACAQCTGVHTAGRDACRCGPEGCADSMCPGRSTVRHLPDDDTEGGAA